MLEAQQRQALLAAMGIDVYLLRGSALDAAASSATPLADSVPEGAAPPQEGIGLLVACARAGAEDAGRTQRLRALLPLALGVAAPYVRWIEADPAGELGGVPAARAYLALGAAMPRALGAHLSTMQQMSSTIAAADAPAASLRDGLAKRALWQALKPLARTLRSH